MKYIICAAVAAFLITQATAQAKKEQETIKNLCGCYDVDFKYAETFSNDTGYAFHPRYHVGGLEWVVAEEAGNKKIVIQHLLVIDDSTVIKHWREDWEYEKSDWWQFDHNAAWKHTAKNKSDVKGEWTQTVWEVDDAPRYQGSSRWISNNQEYYWENTSDAPLPRREYTKRHDYNVMKRTNRIYPTGTGWVHEQDNQKIMRSDGVADVYLVGEKGYNTYTRVSDSKCRLAAEWWKQHRGFWNDVRAAWESILRERKDLHLIKKVDDKFLSQQLEGLEQQHPAAGEQQEKIRAIIMKYIDSSK